MKNLFVYYEKGDGLVNEDVYGHSGQFAWVIDGATDVFGISNIFVEHDVSNYVTCLNRAISDIACDYSPCQIGQLVEDALHSVYCDLDIDKKAGDIPEYMQPTFAIAMVAASDETIYYLILGDCFISFPSKSGFDLLIDDRISRFSKRNRRKLRAFFQKNNRMPDSPEIYQHTRSKANAQDGYPIGSVRGTGIPFAKSGSFHMKQGQRFIICSDGFLDYYRINSANNINFFSLSSIQKEIDAMNSFLSDDAVFFSNLRPHRTDDRTLMLMEV